MSVPIFTLDSVFAFGKHKDDTVDRVLDCEPSYVEWCVEQRIFVLDDDADEALLVALERHRKEP